MKKRLSLLLLFFSTITYSQDYSEIHQLLFEKINELRVSQGLLKLESNDTLQKAAEFHSKYMATRHVLSHNESSSKTSTPRKRVDKFSGKNFDLVGENVLFISIEEKDN